MAVFSVFISILLLLCVIVTGYLLKGRRYKSVNSFASGMISGILLQAVILSAAQSGYSYNVYAYAAMFLGMGICVLGQMMNKSFIQWLFPGLLAGAVISYGSMLSVTFTVLTVFVLISNLLKNENYEKHLNYIFMGMLLFFSGEVFGYSIQYFVPEVMPVFFAFGTGACIYICSEHILPEEKERVFSLMGGISGFLAGMILYMG